MQNYNVEDALSFFSIAFTSLVLQSSGSEMSALHPGSVIQLAVGITGIRHST